MASAPETRPQRLTRNVGGGIASALIMFGTLALTYPFYLRSLGTKQYGLWLLMATILNAAQLSSMGMGPALARLVAYEQGRGGRESIGRHWWSASLMVTALGSAAVVISLLVRSEAGRLLRIEAGLVSEVQFLMPVVAALSVLMLLVEAAGAVAAGLGRSDLSSYSQAAAQAASSLLPMILIKTGLGIKSFPLAIAVSYSIVLVLLLTWSARELGPKVICRFQFSRQSLKDLLNVGLALSGSSLVQLALVSSLRVLLSRYAGLSAIPVYDLAYNGSLRLRNVIETGLRALMPEISQLRARLDSGAPAEIRRLYRRATFLTVAGGVLIYSAAGLSSDWVLRLWLGHSYTPEFHVALQFALLGTFLSLAGVPAYYTLMGLGLGLPLLIEKAVHAGLQLSLIVIAAPLNGLLSSAAVLAAGAAGMGGSTLYLLWRAHTATRAPHPASGGFPL